MVGTAMLRRLLMPPTMLMQSLEGLRRRVRMLSVAFGVGVALAAAVGALIAVVLRDYVLNLPAIPRVIALIAAIAALCFVLFRWVLSPRVTRRSVRDVAARLEERFPQFNDRLRSTVDFLRGQ